MRLWQRGCVPYLYSIREDGGVAKVKLRDTTAVDLVEASCTFFN